MIRDFERERERLIVKGKKEMEDYVLEAEGMKKLLKHKTREQGKIKKLAQEIVSQRTEVEQFFLDALDTVCVRVLRACVWHRSSCSSTTDSTRCCADVARSCMHVACVLYVLWHVCCKHVAGMLQACCKHVASMLQACCKHVTSMLQACCMHVFCTYATFVLHSRGMN